MPGINIVTLPSQAASLRKQAGRLRERAGDFQKFARDDATADAVAVALREVAVVLGAEAAILELSDKAASEPEATRRQTTPRRSFWRWFDSFGFG